jgi:hypothetical protein
VNLLKISELSRPDCDAGMKKTTAHVENSLFIHNRRKQGVFHTELTACLCGHVEEHPLR